MVSKKPVILIGHSLGAIISVLYASTCPGRVEELILVEPPLSPFAQDDQSFAQQLTDHLSASEEVRKHDPMPDLATAAARLRELTPALSAETAFSLAGRLTQPLGSGAVWRWDARLDGQAQLDSLFAGVRRTEFLSMLAGIKAGMMIVFGNASGWISPADRMRILDARPESQSTILPGGHNVHMDSPAALARVVCNPSKLERKCSVPITTIFLIKTVPLGLAPELRTRLFFVSPEIVDFSLVERNARVEAVTVTTAAECEPDLSDKINRLIETDILTQRVFKPKIIWQSPNEVPKYHADLFETMVARGLAFEAAEGQVGFAEPLIGLMDYFDRRIKQIALSMTNAQEFQYPTLLPTSVLDTFGYFGSFPHFAMFVTRLHNDIDVYEAFRAEYSVNKRITRDLFTHCQNHDYCLPPTMCYHTYHQLRGTVAEQNRVVTAKGKSFVSKRNITAALSGCGFYDPRNRLHRLARVCR